MKNEDLLRIEKYGGNNILYSNEKFVNLISNKRTTEKIKRILSEYIGYVEKKNVTMDLDTLVYISSLMHHIIQKDFKPFINEFGEKDIEFKEMEDETILEINYELLNLDEYSKFDSFPFVIEFLNKIRFDNDLIDDKYGFVGSHKSFIIFLVKLLENYKDSFR